MIGGMFPHHAEILAQGARSMLGGLCRVDDLAATLAAMLAAGGRQISDRMDIPEGSLAMVMDPQGAPFYLMQPTPGEGAPSVAFDPGADGRCGWNELHTADAGPRCPSTPPVRLEPARADGHGRARLLPLHGRWRDADRRRLHQDAARSGAALEPLFPVPSIKTAAAAIADKGGRW
jgi:hypothetical protein